MNLTTKGEFEIHAVMRVERAWKQLAGSGAESSAFALTAKRAILDLFGWKDGEPLPEPRKAVIAGFFFRDNNGNGAFTPGEETSATLLGAPVLKGVSTAATLHWNCYWFPVMEPGRKCDIEFAPDGVKAFMTSVTVKPGLNLVHIPIKPAKPIFYVVPHSHFDPEWMKTYEAYMADELPQMLERFEEIRKNPSHGFSLDEESVLRPLVERYPHIVDEMRQRIKDGTAEPKAIVVAGDLTMPLGESIIRQITLGERILAELVGMPVTTEVFWNVDNYGTCFQLPQILVKSGRKYFLMGEYRWTPSAAWPNGAQGMPDWYNRGQWGEANPHYREDMPFSDPAVWNHSEFFMKGLDGSKVLVHRSVYGSAPLTRIMGNEKKPSHLSYFNFYGGDFAPPDRKLVGGISELNARGGDYKCIIATAPQFFKAVENAPDIPTFTTESWMGEWSGSYETRVKGRQYSRRLECMLLAMESYSCMARLHGIAAPDAELRESWYLLLINHHHDPQMTPMGPRLMDEVLDRYREVEKRAYRLFPLGLTDKIVSNERKGIPFVVFNPLPWPVTRVVEAAGGSKVIDSKGKPAVTQLAGGSDDLERKKVLFLAEDVPAMGWRSYFVGKRGRAHTGGADAVKVGGNTMENARLKVEFKDGLVQRIVRKDTGRAAVESRDNAAVNEVFVWKDDGCICIIRPVEFASKAVLAGRSSGAQRKFRFIESGPLRAVAETKFKLDGGIFTQRIILEAAAVAVRFETTVDWRPSKTEGRRVRVAFPFAAKGAKVLRDTPFAVLPGEQNHVVKPVNGWLGLVTPDEKIGAALIHQGTCSIQAADDTMWMTLFRSVRVDKGQCTSGWDIPGDRSLEAGESEYVYWLSPFEGGWQEAGVPRTAYEMNMAPSALEVYSVWSRGGLPAEKTNLLLEPVSLSISAVKPAEDGRGIIVRAFNPGSGTVAGKITVGFDASGAEEIDFLEKKTGDLALTDGVMKLNFAPFEVKTVRILVPTLE